MKKTFSWLVILLLAAGAVAAKPRSPLVLQAQLETPWQAGQIAELKVVFASHSDMAHLELRLQGEDGAVLLGQPGWRGGLQAGESITRIVQLRVPETGRGGVLIELGTGHDGRTRYLLRTRLPRAAVVGKASGPDEGRRIERQDRGVREYVLP